MDMNMDMTGEDRTDYSDFERQHLDFEHTEVGTGNSERGIVTASVEPLQGQGGLETHEVAELVAQHVTIYVEPDNYGGATNTDTAPGSIEFRGVFGSDLGAKTDLVSDQPDGRNTFVGPGEATDLFGDDGSDANLFVRGHDKNEVFDQFATISHVGFDDDTNGVGGGGSETSHQYSRNYRQMYGAGPIIDSSDEIGVVSALIKNQVDLNGVSAHYRTSLIWDIATVEDAGRRFGIPQ